MSGCRAVSNVWFPHDEASFGVATLRILLGLWVALSGVGVAAASQAPAEPLREVVTDVRVHGNQITPDAEIVRLAGIAPGDPFESSTIARVRAALDHTGKFRHIDVLKRFASIADPSQILIVIVVDEGPVSVEAAGVPGEPVRVVRRRALTNVMFMPILEGEDGYGLTYGARVAYVGVTGKRGRLSMPLAWGGRKQAGVVFERDFVSGPLTRFQVGAAIGRSTNPAFREDDTRRRMWIRAERAMGLVRTGGEIGRQTVEFGGVRDRVRSVGADVTFDTRVDPVLPRNAVYAAAGWTHLQFADRGVADRTGVDRVRLDGRAYRGLIGQSVIVARVLHERTSGPLPDYLDPLLGGWSSLRGFRAGSFVGDRLLQSSLELRVPVSSPLQAAKLGVSAFADSGTGYDWNQRLADRPFHTGIGGSAWLVLTAFRAEFSVAHGLGAGTRVNFGLGLLY